MNMRVRSSCLMVLAALLPLSACFKLSRQSPRLQQFVLSGAPPTSTAEVRAGRTLALRRIDLAAYLAVPAIIIRRGANEVVVSEFHRWGEDLSEGINRVVAANLAGAPSVRAVHVAPWQIGARHDFLVQLHVSRFEGIADSAATQGRIHLLASWDIISPGNGALLMRGTTDERGGSWRVGDYAGLVTELDAALSRMARDIAACVARFPNDSTPPASCGAAAQ
ncbi:PqiC family protein [Gemmatimonas groenlandica]|uniref:Membrane integrity-associated transporter subunit PqiC n=1 Tax=Gemmatimonas groenlandica TaxID=2732249 RepID=A0A6M4IJX2_9BACT|nr:PqiC family protein [Gemmatimonas groenlandica]QJR35374.1 membrane integrity-associated transporter subunit PqiC [Gemmatimonas groenlandica]